MAQTKNTRSKSSKVKALVRQAHDETENEEEAVDHKTLKAKKPAEFDLPEDAVSLPLEDKSDEDILDGDESDDAIGEEVSLDEEDLNPFGDKWEQ